MNIHSLIQDSKLLNSLEDTENLETIIPFELNLIDRLYSNDYNFNNKELIILSEQLNYLDCNKLDDILIFIKDRNIDVNLLNENLQLKIKEIKLDNNLFNIFLQVLDKQT